MAKELNTYVAKYLDGELSADDSRWFEEQIKNDSSLQEELSRQQQLIDGIRSARHLQLKARLQAIQPSASFFNFRNTLRIAAAVAPLILVGGLYAYNSDFLIGSDPTPTQHEYATELDAQFIPAFTVPSEVIPVEETTTPIAQEELVAPAANTVVSTKPSTNQETLNPLVSELVKKEGVSLNTAISLPEIPKENESIEINAEIESIAEVRDPFTKVGRQLTPKTTVEIKQDNIRSPRYRSINSRLYLFGTFESPYELIEIQNEGSTQIYLNYQDKFYFIKQNQEKIVPLVAIRDSYLINDLKSRISK